MPERYDEKRDFTKTPEPSMERKEGEGPLTFVIQKHAATNLHYDLRLELDGVLLSWAVPKGPSYDPQQKHLAVMVEDHPLDYASFEGVIPEGNYGAGEVIVWDNGIYSPDESGELLFYDREKAQAEMREGLKKGKLGVFFSGTKMKGSFALVKLTKSEKNEWLFFKHNDEYANSERDVLQEGRSVISGLTIEDLKAGKNPQMAMHVASAPKASSLPGAVESPIPLKLTPMQAGMADHAFDGAEWLFEPKMDGIRALAVFRNGKWSLITRNGNDVSRQYPALVEELGKQIAQTMVLDGEIVAFDEKGAPSFHQLQQRMNLQHDGDIKLMEPRVPVYFFAFDLLYHDGYDITACPLADRKSLLKKVVLPTPKVAVLDHFEGHGIAAYDAAIKHGMEGIVAKKRYSKYEPGKRSANWLKIKAMMSDEFVVGGFSRGLGGRSNTFGAMLLGVPDGKGKLTYVGHVGSGFSDADLDKYLARLEPLSSDENPFNTRPPLKTPATWVKPELIAEVKFHQFTPDGHLRAPVFLRLRDDLSIGDVRKSEVVKIVQPEDSKQLDGEIAEVLEQLAKSEKDTQITVGSYEFGLTNPTKHLWPEFTKRDLLVYFAKVSQYLLPHLQDRPLTLSRYPNGVDGGMFYQKHWEHNLPPFVDTVRLFSGSNEEDQEYLVCNNLATLLWLGQLADIELHPWTSRTNPQPDAHGFSLEFTGSDEAIGSSVLNYPDYLLFDIDPYIYSGKEKAGDEPEYHAESFKKGCEVAFWLKELLDTMKLNAFVKTSGKTGLHIYVPIVRNRTSSEVRAIAGTICNYLVQQHTKDLTTEWAVEKRTGKIFLDFNQNTRGKTLASIYSPRAIVTGAVSVPLDWKELGKSLPTEYTIATVPKILAEKGDFWANILQSKTDLRKAIG